MSPRTHASALGLLTVLVSSAALGVACGTAPPAVTEKSEPAGNRPLASNVLRRDYAGSKSCQACHQGIYDKWLSSPMHRMTRPGSASEITAPFDGRSFELGGDSATMEREGDASFIRVRSKKDGALRYRVTKVIGGRYREDFAGVLVDEQGQVIDAEEKILPVSWLRFDQTYRYKGYSVMSLERGGMKAGPVWKKTCILCHNTAPLFVSRYDDLLGAEGVGAPSGLPVPVYQGTSSAEQLDQHRVRYRLAPSDAGLHAAVDEELSRFGPPGTDGFSPSEVLDYAARSTESHFGEGDLVELGVGCESCHGGSRAHVEDPAHVRTSFAEESDLYRLTSSDGAPLTAAEEENKACARCHTVLFSRYPYTWEGQQRKKQPGGSHITSGEARDLSMSRCSRALSCSACHDPHAEDPKNLREDLRGPRGTALCTGCHTQFGSAEARTRHAHHREESTGCIDCHMPRKNLGLAYDLTTYHRIGSPNAPDKLYGDRPIECALCHLDQSVGELAKTIEDWWQKPVDRDRLIALYGGLDRPPIGVALLTGKPHERATAAAVVGEHQAKKWLPQLVSVTEDPYPLVRFYALRAIERVTGEKLDLDWHGDAATLRASVEAKLKKELP